MKTMRLGAVGSAADEGRAANGTAAVTQQTTNMVFEYRVMVGPIQGGEEIVLEGKGMRPKPMYHSWARRLLERSENAYGGTVDRYVSGKSDDFVVSTKWANKSPPPAKLGEVGRALATSGRGCDFDVAIARMSHMPAPDRRTCPLPNVAEGSIRPPPTALGEVTDLKSEKGIPNKGSNKGSPDDENG